MRYVFKEDIFRKLFFENDRDLSFAASMVQFTEGIEIRKCKVKEFDVFGMYCGGGLVVKDSEFDCDINWESGGYNKEPVLIENCIFNRFVNFEDCCFENAFILKNVTFAHGTNLLGNKGTPVRVGFGKYPLFDNVIGELTVDTFKLNPVGK